MAFALQSLGKIVRLQVQPSTLTLGARTQRYYDPAPLMTVKELTLTPYGASAHLPTGEMLDVHNSKHPITGNMDGTNDLSVNFTSHYDIIRERFGRSDHLFNGCGGENILVSAEGRIDLDRLTQGIAVKSARTGALVRLKHVKVARPCDPFSKYVSRSVEAETIKSTLQFLDEGTRGFYCVSAQDETVTIAVGDEVFVTLL